MYLFACQVEWEQRADASAAWEVISAARSSHEDTRAHARSLLERSVVEHSLVEHSLVEHPLIEHAMETKPQLPADIPDQANQQNSNGDGNENSLWH